MTPSLNGHCTAAQVQTGGEELSPPEQKWETWKHRYLHSMHHGVPTLYISTFQEFYFGKVESSITFN